jgi:hypothetical protein
MAKGQQHKNREAKKPKEEKPKVAATAQLNLLKSTGGEGRSRQEEIARRNATWLTCDQRAARLE